MSVRLVNPRTDDTRAQPAPPEFERWMVCNGCGVRILVCGAVSDLTPGEYRGMACGCRRPRVPWELLFKAPRGVKV